MADCIKSRDLMGKHTNDLFERGLSSLKIKNTSTKLFKKLPFEFDNTNCRVKEIASAISTNGFIVFNNHIISEKQLTGLSKNFTQVVIKK